MMRGIWVALVCVLAVPLGCSSGSASPSTGGGSGSCDSVCAKLLAVGCPNDNAQKCAAECQDEFGTNASQCPNEASSYIGCVQQLPFECNADGEAVLAGEASQIYDTCGPQVQALGACTACNADPDDDACDACQKQNCCSQMKAYISDPATLDYFQCIDACSDSTCYQACGSQYPSLQTKLEAVASCQASSCSSAC